VTMTFAFWAPPAAKLKKWLTSGIPSGALDPAQHLLSLRQRVERATTAWQRSAPGPQPPQAPSRAPGEQSAGDERSQRATTTGEPERPEINRQ
jgi:hypothetical protein